MFTNLNIYSNGKKCTVAVVLCEIHQSEQLFLNKSLTAPALFARKYRRNVALLAIYESLIERSLFPQALVCFFPVVQRQFSPELYLQPFTAETDFFSILLEAAIGFTAETNHLSAMKLFF